MQFTKPLLGLALAGLLSACAALPPGERDPRDRFERTNRAVYRFNDSLDRHVARPVAKAYVKVTPRPVRSGVSNFYNNLTYPTVIVNNLLQGKIKHFFSDTARLVVNTTIGIGGLFDPASQLGLPSHDEDLGQTLGKWGVPPGPYLVLPFLGPSTVRDGVGLVGDQFSDPQYYLINDWPTRIGLALGSLLDTRASLLGTDEVLTGSYDPYAFMRNAYLQRRDFLVKDGAAPPDEEFEIFEDEEEPAAPAATDAPQ